MAVLYKEQVGEAIKKRRDDLGLTQPQLADRVEKWLREHDKRDEGKPFDAQNISRWERGTNMASETNLEAVAAALETDIPSLIGSIKASDAPKRPVPSRAELRDQLDQIEKKLDYLIGRLFPDEPEEVAQLLERASEASPPASGQTRSSRRTRRAARPSSG